jgi:uroporphyrinogen-III synthase
VRLLLTRPEADAARTAAALRARGHEAIVAPLLTIELLPGAVFGAGPWSAILVTSANAIRAMAAYKERKALQSIPVFAVGSQSAQDIRAAGFGEVTAADGDADDLASLVAARIKPPARLLYLAGENRSGDLAGALRAKDFAVDMAIVYRAVRAEGLPHHAAAALAVGVDGVLHFSRRSAEAYVSAVRKAHLTEAGLASPTHFCLSDRIAEPLLGAGAVKVRIAARPDEAALLALCG